MEDASAEINKLLSILREQFPQFANLEVPARLTNSVTLSTMHGCPPDEIEQIARYLLEERALHTIVKLNPTLLGKEAVLDILHERLGYRDIQIPDSVFEHDLRYPRAVELIASLKRTAAARDLFFGVKLSNTLAMANHRGELPGDEMYMSGRALYPITMNLFHRLVQEFDGELNVSYSAGADALNVTSILAAGACPVTVASDLLKPGGYARFAQYLENLSAEMAATGASSLKELAQDRVAHLGRAAVEALEEPRYKKAYFPFGLPKVESKLEAFDCVVAPCMEQCAVCQEVPEYAWLIARGEYDRALEVILHRNPLPGVTGYVCTHLCQTRCTRNNYDEPVLIRDLKRFATEYGQVQMPNPEPPVTKRVAIIGSGPAGLAAAYFLGLNGIQSTIFEAREMPGGMLAIAPHFRLPPEVVQTDIDRITSLGAELKLGQRVTTPPEELLADGFDAVYIATGFQKDASLGIEGIEGEGVFTAIRFLEMVAQGEKPELGTRVLVIGGGNTAMDAARTAQRLTGEPATVVYRRTQAEMPAEAEELRDLFAEGNELIELASPNRVILTDGRVIALECVRNELAEPGPDGRRRPEPIEGSEFRIEADSVFLAIGQKPDIAFLNGSGISFRRDGSIVTDTDTGQAQAGVYAGGDVARGPAIIIQACADGRQAAEAICKQFGVEFRPPAARLPALAEEEIIQVKGARAAKSAQHEPALLPVEERAGFALVEQTLTEEAARAEAARCLQCSTLCDKCVEVCPNRANYAYQVEPVNWTLPVLSCQNGELTVSGSERFEVRQARQILHVDDLCNECGNCATFCVHQGKPYTDKPRLFFDRGTFLEEDNNAFYVENSAIVRREGGQETQVTMQDGGMVLESPQLRLSLSVDGGTGEWKIEQKMLKASFEGMVSFRREAEMAILLNGVRSSLAFLPIIR
jgi:putative selenate reductase